MADWTELYDNPDQWTTLQYNDPRLDAFAEAVEDKYGLPPGILVALKNAGERTPNPDGRWKSSPKGAQGLMQFMPDTMRLQNGKFQHDPNNPFESLTAAGRYIQHTLKYQYDGDVARAIADYNGGPDAVKALENGTMGTRNDEGDIIFEETTNYLRRVRGYITRNYSSRLSERLQQRQQGREPNE